MSRAKCFFAAWGVFSMISLLAGGCAPKPEVVPSSGPHPATVPEQIKIYQNQPARYERLGLVTVPIAADARWDERGHAKAGFDKLKQKAAALGANGVLLDLPPGVGDYVVLVGDGENFYRVLMRRKPREARADAIFVLKE
jgi:hypothetical protein